jgi:hypothetical protein
VSNVHEIKRESLLNIGAQLRRLADWAEANPDAVRTVIIISAAHDRVVCCHGYGDRCSAVEALGWLELAKDRVLGNRVAPSTDMDPAA